MAVGRGLGFAGISLLQSGILLLNSWLLPTFLKPVRSMPRFMCVEQLYLSVPTMDWKRNMKYTYPQTEG